MQSYAATSYYPSNYCSIVRDAVRESSVPILSDESAALPRRHTRVHP